MHVGFDNEESKKSEYLVMKHGGFQLDPILAKLGGL